MLSRQSSRQALLAALGATLGVALVACHSISATGDAGMKGVLVDFGGEPIAGVRVQSIEAEARTGEDGSFAVAWKAPEFHVFFERQGLFWQRTLTEADRGGITEIRLPMTRKTPLLCQVDCAVRLDFRHGPLSARYTGTCVAGETLAPVVPPVTPEVQCTDGPGGDAVPHALVEGPDGWILGPPARPVRVQVLALDGSLPDDCAVWVGDTAATALGEGFFSAEVPGATQAHARCEGRPTLPVPVAADAGSVAVEWSAVGPHLDLAAVAPWVQQLTLETGGRTLPLEADAEGRFLLPPLPEGTYELRVGQGGGALEPVADRVVLTQGEGWLRGVLKAQTDQLDGPLHLAD